MLVKPLGADLANFGRQEFIVPDDLVGTEWTTGRRAGDAQTEFATTEKRHVSVILMTKFVGDAFLDQPDRTHHDLRLLVPIGRTSLVAFAP